MRVWYCHAKAGGCGANYDADDPAIVKQECGQIENPDVYDAVNTIQKMAQKRALIAAVLIAANASEFFTQDVEDLGPIAATVDGELVNRSTGEVREDAPDLSRDDDFLFLWDATAEAKGLDHKTGRSLLGAACKKRKVDFFTADMAVRQQLLDDLKVKSPADLEKFRKAAGDSTQSPVGPNTAEAQAAPGAATGGATMTETPSPSPAPGRPAGEPSIDQAADAIGADAGDLTTELWAEFQSNLWQKVREKNDNRKLYDNAVKAWLVKLSLVGKGEQTTMEARRQFMEAAEQERGAWAYLAK